MAEIDQRGLSESPWLLAPSAKRIADNDKMLASAALVVMVTFIFFVDVVLVSRLDCLV